MKKKTIVVLEVEYEFDEAKTTQEFAEQDAVCLAVRSNFSSVQNGTKLISVTDLTERDIAQSIAGKLLERDGFFYITSVHRDDLEERGFDVSNVTGKQMRRLANQMSEDYCNQLFYESMEILAEGLGIPRKEKQDEQEE